ncbi:unnamed protein product, partial [Mesorhabditis belari]|uniref:Uncharacterized protein n=1 Tax=Mesorhabditis belari TaxID=2138241 RepID=A0AAF3F9B5_9BILA
MSFLKVSLLICLLWQKNDAAKYNEFVLDELNPSFALHGMRLKKLESITVFGCDGCDFLIDYTQRGCTTEQENICKDPIPFTINWNNLDPSDGQQEVIPFQDNSNEFFYAFAFKCSQESELAVTLTGENSNLEFAISFRVLQWVDEGKKVIVLPGSGFPDNPFYVLVRENWVITTVTFPPNLTYDHSPNVALEATKWDQTFASTCQTDEDLKKCATDAKYSIYFGSAPGKKYNERNHLTDLEANLPLNPRTSASTIFAVDNCAFCLKYTINPVVPGLDLASMWSSFYYPWSFDRADLYTDCWTWTILFSATNRLPRPVILELPQLKGGRLQIIGFGWLNDNAGCDIVIFRKTFLAPLDEPLRFSTYCFNIQFCTDYPLGDPDQGYVLLAHILVVKHQ